MAAKERELISVNGTKRYVRRDNHGRFTSDQVSVGRSLGQDTRQHAETVVTPGQGDRGDQKRR